MQPRLAYKARSAAKAGSELPQGEAQVKAASDNVESIEGELKRTKPVEARLHKLKPAAASGRGEIGIAIVSKHDAFRADYVKSGDTSK